MKPQRSYASGFLDALALVTIAILIFAAALVAGGCSSSSELVELASECPSGLLCSCERDEECAGYGQGGARGACLLGLCTIGCDDDDPCREALPDAVCGPLSAAGHPVCALPCDEPDASCEPSGLHDAVCTTVVDELGALLVCGGAL